MRASEAETGTDTGEVTHFQATDLTKEFRYKSGISGNRPLRCERVSTTSPSRSQTERCRACRPSWAGGAATTLLEL
jgi:hypothetical protein